MARIGNKGPTWFGRLWDFIVRANSGKELAGRRRLNVVAGTNVTVTLVDAPAQNEAVLTIAASGGGGGAANPSVMARVWMGF